MVISSGEEFSEQDTYIPSLEEQKRQLIKYKQLNNCILNEIQSNIVWNVHSYTKQNTASELVICVSVLS